MEKRLGKGIGALIPEKEAEEKSNVSTVSINTIVPNKYQPRKRFDNEKLKELIDSIKEKGVIQPIIVRPVENGYELIAGERRFRAAKELGYSEIPVIIREASEVDSLELSLIENIQREELNSIEEANAYKQLMDKFNINHDDISKRVGKDKSTISNTLRLLGLPSAIQKYVEENLISTGHAKAILSLVSDAERIKLANDIIKRSLSVRQAEELAKAKNAGTTKRKKEKDNNLFPLEEKLQHALGTRVKINHGKKRGKIEIEYYSNEDLERIIGIITK